MTEGEAKTLSYVRAAIEAVPSALSRALECPLPRLARAPRSVVTSGVGASEGPARILAAQLLEAGMVARFVPVSQFSSRAPAADLLVLFSQGLSPNARLALGKEHAFAARWLVTSVGSAQGGAKSPEHALLATLAARGITPIVVPPADEPQALARFTGPTVAALSALRLAALLSADRALAMRLADAPAAYASFCSHADPRASTFCSHADPRASTPRAQTAQLTAPLALVTAGALAESAYAQRWKLLEALLGDDPPVWDVLQFAHGPLQASFAKRFTLLVLEGVGQGELVERLARTLAGTQHRLLRLAASLPAPLSFFQHTAQLDALLSAQLEATPRDLFDWPGRHGDAPLYGLGADDPREREVEARGSAREQKEDA
jgi:creatinine amidohydrolase